MTADTQAQGDLVKLAEKCGAVVYRRGETWVMLNFNNPELEAFAAALRSPGTQEGEPSETQFLQEADQHLLHRFIETTEDGEGYDIGKDAVKRLAELGVVQSFGFGRYGVTMFGYWAHERFWLQNPGLPLLTNADRDARAALAQAPRVEIGEAK